MKTVFILFDVIGKVFAVFDKEPTDIQYAEVITRYYGAEESLADIVKHDGISEVHAHVYFEERKEHMYFKVEEHEVIGYEFQEG